MSTVRPGARAFDRWALSAAASLKHLYIVDLKLNDALSGSLTGTGAGVRRMVRAGKHVKRESYM